MRSNIKLFNCDCLPKMRDMPDKAFDLAIDKQLIDCYINGDNSKI